MRPDVCATYVYPLVRVVIRKYASACEVLHDNRVSCLACVRCCTLYTTCPHAPSCDCACCTKKQADISSSSHQTAPEGAVRQQLFVYLDLTCNYVRDRLHHVEKDIFGLPRAQPVVKGRSLSHLITVVHRSRAVPAAPRESEPPSGSHLGKSDRK